LHKTASKQKLSTNFHIVFTKLPQKLHKTFILTVANQTQFFIPKCTHRSLLCVCVCFFVHGVFSFPASSQIWVATGHTRWGRIAAAAQEKAKVADYYSSNTCSHHLACHVVACTDHIYCSLQIMRERKLA
jgi:hypothetical protein